MIEVTLDGYKYNYCKTESGGYWIGISGYKGSMGRYSNCRVPTMLWSPLRAKAYSEGYTAEDFAPPKKKSEPKKAKAKKSKNKKNSISIF